MWLFLFSLFLTWSSSIRQRLFLIEKISTSGAETALAPVVIILHQRSFAKDHCR